LGGTVRCEAIPSGKELDRFESRTTRFLKRMEVESSHLEALEHFYRCGIRQSVE
jgi:hypothetical protein